jgi:hypothetical protein
MGMELVLEIFTTVIGSIPRGNVAQPMFSCHDTPNLSATQANSLLKP